MIPSDWRKIRGKSEVIQGYGMCYNVLQSVTKVIPTINYVTVFCIKKYSGCQSVTLLHHAKCAKKINFSP